MHVFWFCEFGLKTPIHATKLGVFRGRIGEGVERHWPPTNSCLLLGVYTSVSNLVKIDEEMRPRVSTDGHTHTHTQTVITDGMWKVKILLFNHMWSTTYRAFTRVYINHIADCSEEHINLSAELRWQGRTQWSMTMTLTRPYSMTNDDDIDTA